MGITFTQKGNFNNTEAFLKRMQEQSIFAALEKYGARGVAALQAATPIDTSGTANSWTYEVIRRRGYFSIAWRNTNMVDGIPIAVMLQYGHGTGTGGYVPGRDYINPAIKPIIEEMVNEFWKEVTK